MLNKNYDASSTKGRYAAVGIALENRPFLLNKKFDSIDELTSLGIDGRFIFDYKEGRCLSRKYIPEEDRPKLEVKWLLVNNFIIFYFYLLKGLNNCFLSPSFQQDDKL